MTGKFPLRLAAVSLVVRPTVPCFSQVVLLETLHEALIVGVLAQSRPLRVLLGPELEDLLAVLHVLLKLAGQVGGRFHRSHFHFIFESAARVV